MLVPTVDPSRLAPQDVLRSLLDGDLRSNIFRLGGYGEKLDKVEQKQRSLYCSNCIDHEIGVRPLSSRGDNDSRFDYVLHIGVTDRVPQLPVEQVQKDLAPVIQTDDVFLIGCREPPDSGHTSMFSVGVERGVATIN